MLPTTVVGSHPPPDWLVDCSKLNKAVHRIRADVWRVAPPYLQQAQDDATVLAVREMENAGIDIVTDGEIRRESYSNRFATALDGIDSDNPGTIIGRAGRPNLVPRIVGRIVRKHSVEADAARFLRSATSKTTKITIPGPFTLTQQSKNEFYADQEEVAMDFAVAVNEEVKDLFEAGIDIVQLDEPWLQAYPEEARRYGVKAINRALQGAAGTTAIHVCFGYAHFVESEKKLGDYWFLSELTDCIVDQVSIEAAQPRLDLGILRDITDKTIMLGVIDLADREVETAETVAARIRAALHYVPAERLIAAPDCGMKYIPRATALGKLRALSDGARQVREELGGAG